MIFMRKKARLWWHNKFVQIWLSTLAHSGPWFQKLQELCVVRIDLYKNLILIW